MIASPHYYVQYVLHNFQRLARNALLAQHQKRVLLACRIGVPVSKVYVHTYTCSLHN